MLIKEITAQETYKLRLEILKTTENYRYKYQGDFDEETLHFGAFIATEQVGLITLMYNKHTQLEGKQAQLRGMAVLKKYQGNGIGEKLVNRVEVELQKKDVTTLWCNARDYAVDFYKSLGFKITGKRFYIEHVCYHYVMYKTL